MTTKREMEELADELARKAEEEVRQVIAEYTEIKVAEGLQSIDYHISQIYEGLTQIGNALQKVTETLTAHIEQGATAHGTPHTHTVPPFGPGHLEPGR